MNTLTKEQVLQLATPMVGDVVSLNRVTDMLNAAFALGAAQEREECAKVAAKFEPDEKTIYVTYPSDAIRARNKA